MMLLPRCVGIAAAFIQKYSAVIAFTIYIACNLLESVFGSGSRGKEAAEAA